MLRLQARLSAAAIVRALEKEEKTVTMDTASHDRSWLTCSPKIEPLGRRLCSANVQLKGAENEREIYRRTNYRNVEGA
jgi:hypothetical protein